MAMGSIWPPPGYTSIANETWARYTAAGDFDLLDGTRESHRIIRVPHVALPRLLRFMCDPAKTGTMADRVDLADEVASIATDGVKIWNRIVELESRLIALENVGAARVLERLANLELRVVGTSGASVVSELAQTVTGLLDTVESLQSQVGQIGAAAAGQHPTLPDHLATKEFVDTAIRRLNGALREHIAKVIAQTIAEVRGMIAPAPGVLRRLADALRPSAPTWSADVATMMATARSLGVAAQAVRVDPTRAAQAGATAAQQAVGEP